MNTASNDLKAKTYRTVQHSWRAQIMQALAMLGLSIIGLAIYVKYLRLPPQIYLAGIPGTEPSDVQMGHQTIDLKLPLEITVYNPNMVSVHIHTAYLQGRLTGTEQFIFRTTVCNHTLEKRGNTVFVQKVDFSYDMREDADMRIFSDLMGKCRNLAESPLLEIEYVVDATYTAVGISGVMHTRGITYLVCPLSMMQFTVRESINTIHKHSHQMLVNSFELVEGAVSASAHVMKRSLNIMRALGDHFIS